jgi:UDP-N-acetylmuramoyl-L-alanyl-D-glutamate--2,6-diaminopimelate ligase
MDILYKVSIRSVVGKTGVEIKDVQIDSRKVKKGCVFVAVKGVAADGHQFIDRAVEAGATAIVCETIPSATKEDVVYVQVENSAAAAGYMAHNFYGQPSEKMKIVGVDWWAILDVSYDRYPDLRNPMRLHGLP